MSKHKNASDRYLILDDLLSRKIRRFTLPELLEKINEALLMRDMKPIGRTQLYKDLKYLEESDYQAPITRTNDGSGHKLIYYKDADYSIRKQALNGEQLKTLQTALETLGRFQGIAEFAQLDELLPRLEQEFGLKVASSRLISFEENAYLKGLEHLNPLLQAVTDEHSLKIDYAPFQGEGRVFDISPYHLKRYNQRWFLFGYTADYEDLTNLALDRMVSIEASSSPFVANTSIDFDAYFDDMIGVTRPEGSALEEVTLSFTAAQAPYMLTKPLHPSQKASENEDGSLTVRIQVIPNYELESLILSFGEKVRVISPQSLKDRIIDRLSLAKGS